MTGAAIPPLALYVHWPFCRAKCPYCDFNSHVAQDIDEARFASAYRREMQHMADRHGRGRNLVSVFFGGGTPSLMSPALVAGILETADRLFGFTPDIEITAEANPTSAEAAVFEGFRAAGVNRVSLGVQSLDDAALAFLGREHSAAEALDAVAAARRRFERVSVDLIYARHGQTLTAWESELGKALDLGLDHLSLYQLTIEPGTVFHTRAGRGERLVPRDEVAAEMYELTASLTTQAGLPAYEISNHAAEGGACRHNLVYWRAHDWIGIGPGAHGRLGVDGGRLGLATRRSPAGWLDSVDANGHGIETVTEDGAGDAVAEMLMMGLRLDEGVSLSAVAARHGDAGTFIDPDALAGLVAAGMLARDDDRLRVTPPGRLLLNRILSELLAVDG